VSRFGPDLEDIETADIGAEVIVKPSGSVTLPQYSREGILLYYRDR
jgi:hypothetical protein